MRIPFVGASNTSRSVNSSVDATINFIPEVDPLAKFPVRLLPRPGLLSFANAGSSGNRGQIAWNGAGYAVISDTLWKLTTAGVATSIGTIGTVSGNVSLAGGRSYMMFVDGTDGWHYDGTTLTKITDVDFPTARVVTWIDNYFIVDDADNDGRMYRSDANDPTAWGSLNFATAERNPDGITSLQRVGQQLFVIGETTTEAWYNDASEGFSFVPMSGAMTDVGAVGRFAVKEASGLLFWIGQSEEGQGAVFRSAGLQGAAVSTPAIEREINAGTDLANATADVVYLEGHLIYLLHVPGGKTLAFDQQTEQWHEWKSYGRSDFRGRNAIHINGTTYFGDAEGSNFFKLDWDTHTDQGGPIERIRRDRHIHADRRLLRHRRLEIEFEAGVGTASLDPQAMMRFSDDGGHQWSPELWRGIGKVGQYKNRSLWNGLGSSRDRVYEIKITDPVKAVLIGGYLEVE